MVDCHTRSRLRFCTRLLARDCLQLVSFPDVQLDGTKTIYEIDVSVLDRCDIMPCLHSMHSAVQHTAGKSCIEGNEEYSQSAPLENELNFQRAD